MLNRFHTWAATACIALACFAGCGQPAGTTTTVEKPVGEQPADTTGTPPATGEKPDTPEGGSSINFGDL